MTKNGILQFSNCLSTACIVVVLSLSLRLLKEPQNSALEKVQKIGNKSLEGFEEPETWDYSKLQQIVLLGLLKEQYVQNAHKSLSTVKCRYNYCWSIFQFTHLSVLPPFKHLSGKISLTEMLTNFLAIQ